MIWSVRCHFDGGWDDRSSWQEGWCNWPDKQQTVLWLDNFVVSWTDLRRPCQYQRQSCLDDPQSPRANLSEPWNWLLITLQTETEFSVLNSPLPRIPRGVRVRWQWFIELGVVTQCHILLYSPLSSQSKSTYYTQFKGSPSGSWISNLRLRTDD